MKPESSKNQTPEEKINEKVSKYLMDPQRIRKPRRWVRMDCPGCLHGSINWMYTLEQQGVFLKLIMMAETYGPIPGLLSDNDLRPYPHDFIAHELHATVELLNSVLAIGIPDGQLFENSHGIFIVNFDEYQFTEYDRQKPSRDARKLERAGTEIHKLCPNCGYKGLTNEKWCPTCEEKGKSSELKKDFKAGKYGHMVVS